ncbi:MULTISPECIES: ribbon-helix-helix domain-containing protein [Sphingomonas]|uniref:ribbon-helix-helix domain-containing protein n=1 Tax=Sphingomonas TaxID=13687 RepID=UPI0012E194F3
MAALHSLHVSLTKTICDYVRSQVALGHYESASEVVRDALQIHAASKNVDLLAEVAEPSSHRPRKNSNVT